MPHGSDTTAGAARTRLFVYNGGFLSQGRVRRILALAGYDIRLGIPREGDAVGIWGDSPTAHRGKAVAARHDAPLLRVEDSFLRSLHPGRMGEPPIGLNLDRAGVHFDASVPSDLEVLLATHPLDDTALLNRARDAMARMRDRHLSKYCAFDRQIAPPDPGYVLVVDQTRDDASVRASGGTDALFREMLVFAQEEHPGARVIIKTHPETAAGLRPGYYSEADASQRVALLDQPISPCSLMEGAVGVYTLSSQLGFEAILAGHKPRVFGAPFYAGWGLTQDENPVPRRERTLTKAQLFAAAMILYPVWYDPYRDALCELETVLDAMEAQSRAWQEDHRGWVASGMRLWKRRSVRQFFGQHGKVSFTETRPEGDDRPQMCWAGKSAEEDMVRVEDGFLRSRGLGAELVPPLSLVTDRSGIYYDPKCPSDLETLIARREGLTEGQRRRAERLVARLVGGGVTKYNIAGARAALPDGHRILIPGQVEDDASIRLGTDTIRTNLALVQAARAANPEAILIYKPHPDVEAGLRAGQVDVSDMVDMVADDADPAHLLNEVQEVWTMTSLLGFEALLRGVRVTTLGAPFYAGWGLTSDLGPVPVRRGARPDLMGLVHAALIDYPRYRDPVTGLPCPVEVAVERLSSGDIPHPGLANRLLSKLQGAFATYAPYWR